MELMSNEGLSLKQMFRKRDLMQELIELGYDLETEMDHLLDAINRKIEELRAA